MEHKAEILLARDQFLVQNPILFVSNMIFLCPFCIMDEDLSIV